MALIHMATLTPSKPELVAGWLATRSWAPQVTDLRQVGAYRFDDPAGEVGIETLLLGTGTGQVIQTPLTYRASPVAGAEAGLIGTLEHSVLGPRWVYDGCADPVWAAAALAAVLTGGTQVEELVDTGDGLVPRDSTATVLGSGTPGTPVPTIEDVTCRDEGRITVVAAGWLELVLARVVGALPPGPHTLTGRWSGGGPAALLVVRTP